MAMACMDVLRRRGLGHEDAMLTCTELGRSPATIEDDDSNEVPTGMLRRLADDESIDGIAGFAAFNEGAHACSTARVPSI